MRKWSLWEREDWFGIGNDFDRVYFIEMVPKPRPRRVNFRSRPKIRRRRIRWGLKPLCRYFKTRGLLFIFAALCQQASYPELTFFLSCLTVQKDPTREENVEVKAKGGNTYAKITESIKDSFKIAGCSFQAGGEDFKAGR